MNRKKTLKIFAAVVAIALLAGVLWMANGLLGNPVSQWLARRAAQTHIARQYPDLDLTLSQANYNFKFSEYNVHAQSETSIDTHFTIRLTSFGQVRGDDYELRVLQKENTLSRVDTLYRQQVEAVVDAPAFPYPSYISFGELYSLDRNVLELDKIYDMQSLGQEAGHIVIYVEDETVTAARAADILLDIRRMLEEGGVRFASIDFELIKPRIDDGPNPDDTRFGVQNFARDEIVKDGLVERLEQAAQALNDYYKEQDAQKDAEQARAAAP